MRVVFVVALLLAVIGTAAAGACRDHKDCQSCTSETAKACSWHDGPPNGEAAGQEAAAANVNSGLKAKVKGWFAKRSPYGCHTHKDSHDALMWTRNKHQCGLGNLAELASMPPNGKRYSESSSCVQAALASPKYYFALMANLEKQYSPENLLFITAVKTYQADPTMDAAREILTTFIQPSGEKNVNIPSSQRNPIEAAFAAGGDVAPNVFDEAVKEVTTMLNNDSCPRFKASPEHKALLDQFNKHNPV